MAWRLGYGKQNKEAERHIRADKKRAAMTDAADPAAPHKKAVRLKLLGIRLVQKNFFTKKQMSYCEWFETDAAREIAYQKAKTQETSPGKLRFIRVERCSRR